VINYCEHGNESLGSITEGEFLEELCEDQLLNGSGPWRWLCNAAQQHWLEEYEQTKVGSLHLHEGSEEKRKNLNQDSWSTGQESNQTCSTNMCIMAVCYMNQLIRLSVGMTVKKLYLLFSPTLQFILFPLVLFQNLQISELSVNVIHLREKWLNKLSGKKIKWTIILFVHKVNTWNTFSYWDLPGSSPNPKSLGDQWLWFSWIQHYLHTYLSNYQTV
jgi:hypothetical protein